MTDVTRILTAIEQGDAKASDKLLPLVYESKEKVVFSISCYSLSGCNDSFRGKNRSGITALVCEELPPSTPLKFLFSFLALLALISIIVVPILLGSTGIVVLILPLYIVNLLASNVPS